MYMMWFDDGKKPVAQKIEEAVAAYVRHFRERPNVVLVCQEDAATVVVGIEVRASPTVRPNNFWVGVA